MDKRHKMHPKRTPVALIVIAALHALIAAVCTLYLLNRTPTFKELIDPNFRAPQPPPARQRQNPQSPPLIVRSRLRMVFSGARMVTGNRDAQFLATGSQGSTSSPGFMYMQPTILDRLGVAS